MNIWGVIVANTISSSKWGIGKIVKKLEDKDLWYGNGEYALFFLHKYPIRLDKAGYPTQRGLLRKCEVMLFDHEPSQEEVDAAIMMSKLNPDWWKK